MAELVIVACEAARPLLYVGLDDEERETWRMRLSTTYQSRNSGLAIG